MSEQSLTQRLDHLILAIEDANHAIDDGTVPPMNVIDQQVAKLCIDVQASSPADAKQAQPLMAKMITKLDELAVKLKDFQAKDKT